MEEEVLIWLCGMCACICEGMFVNLYPLLKDKSPHLTLSMRNYLREMPRKWNKGQTKLQELQ